MDGRIDVWTEVDKMYFGQDTDQRKALLNTVMNIPVPYNPKNFLVSRTAF
jgi:hypothetical protein